MHTKHEGELSYKRGEHPLAELEGPISIYMLCRLVILIYSYSSKY